MTLEKWYDYPTPYSLVKRDVFFDELKVNLINVIQDYADLGVADEASLIQRTQKLFTGRIVPAKKDWVELEDILNTLIQNKEFRNIWTNLFKEAKPTLNIEDLTKIRQFLDDIQRMSPIVDSFNMTIPSPNITRLTRPKLSSPDNFENSMRLTWGINSDSLNLKKGQFNGPLSRNEDILNYQFIIKAGSFNQTKSYPGTSSSINHEITLDWWNWFGLNIKNALMEVTYIATDKRGNASHVVREHRFPSNVKMQTPIKSYEIEYKINSNNWSAIGKSTTPTFNWNTIPKITGNYYFRVRGLDQINQYTDWVESDPLFIEYIDYSLSQPIVSASPTINSITATWNNVDKAEHYDIWIDDETSAKNSHTQNNTRWVTQDSSKTRSVVFNNLSSSKKYKITVRARNRKFATIGHTYATTLTPKPVPKTKTYLPIGNQVWNGGYKWLYYINTPSGSVRSPGWHNGGIGDSTGCYQGEWVDGRWTGDQNWAGYTWRGGWAYQAWDGQHWGNRMSFIHYDYNQIKNDIKGKTVTKVEIKAVRANSYHGYHKGHPLYLYNHKRDYTGNISSNATNSSNVGGKIYTVKAGDSLSKIAKAHGITVAQLKQWNNLTSDLIHPGDKLQVSQGASRPVSNQSDNSLTLYRSDNLAKVTQNNEKDIYGWKVQHGASISISNAMTIQLVNNIANGDMKGIGMVKYYGPSLSTPAGYNNHDLAYMSFNKGSFALTVTYQ